MTILPYDLTKVNRNCVQSFMKECEEQGVVWQTTASKINKMQFRVMITTAHRAYLMDGKSQKGFWVSKSVLLKVKETADETNLRPAYNND